MNFQKDVKEYRDYINLLIFGIALAVTAALMIGGLREGIGALTVGVLRGQEDLFTRTEAITECTGKKVHIRSFDSSNELRNCVQAGEIDLYIGSVFNHLINPHEYLAVAASETDYILAGNLNSDPLVLGITDPHISNFFIEQAPALAGKRISVQTIRETERSVLLKEGVINLAIFRPFEPISPKFRRIATLSELGIRHDVLCVKKSLLQEHEDLAKAIFMSSSTESQMLPSESEWKPVMRFLFQKGLITERKQYREYVHIEEAR